MRIQEAIDSGYDFKRRVHKEWMSKEGLDGKILVMSFDDIVADDWEINKTKKKYWRWAYRQEGREGWEISLGYYDDNMRDAHGDRFLSDEYKYDLCKLESDYVEV